MSIICFYHRADPDGWCSAALLYHEISRVFGKDALELYGIDYGDIFPWNKINPQLEVWMLDFALQPFVQMVDLRERCKTLTWIDHHKTAVDEAEGYDTTFLGLQQSGMAACELTWIYLYGGSPMPEAVRLIGRYDVWKWQDIPDALEFNVGLRAAKEVNLPTSGLWRELVHPDHEADADELIAEFINTGTLLLDYRNDDWRIYATGHTFLTILEMIGEDASSYKVGACNRGGANGQFFDSSAIQEKFKNVDFFISFAWKKGLWQVRLWKPDWLKNDIDCGSIAKFFGGGGHAGAAGFQRTREQGLPFELR